MRRIALVQVDAFSREPFGGNPAAVVLEASGLSEAEMQRVAQEMNLAETAFLLPASRPDADYRLRWFTPSREVTFCGHATVATVHTLVEAGRVRPEGRRRLTFETLGGLLPVTVEQADGAVLIWLEPAVPALEPYADEIGPLAQALGCPPEELAQGPAALTPERDLIIPCRSLRVLHLLSPDSGLVARAAAARQLRGLCLTTFETVEPASLIHSRFFAPHYGIPEDPVTGSVHASLAVYCWETGRVPAEEGRHRFTAEQGDALDRPGRLLVEIEVERGRVRAVRVGGAAVTVLSGTLVLPES